MTDPFWDEITDPPMHYDRLGVPISLREWAGLMEDDSYRVIAHTMVGDILVSTVWLGLDHAWGFRWPPESPHIPVIFETMVFNTAVEGDHRSIDLEQRRYSTEDQARLGHAEMVEVVRIIEETADVRRKRSR